MPFGIPIIDFEKCGLHVDGPKEADLESVGEELVKAFATVGFAYMKNTGVPSEKIEDVHRTMKEFCFLPSDTKSKYALDECYHGYGGIGGERINTNRPGDLKELFNLVGRGMHRPDVKFPDKHVPGFSEAWKDLYGIGHKLAERVLDLLGRGLKLKDKDYLKRCHSRMGGRENYTTLKAIYYPPISDDVIIEPGQIRLGEHSDYGTITFLFHDQVGGLEIEDSDGKFVEAKHIPGTVLVNVADSLQFWTEGRLKSARHRVMLPSNEYKKIPRQSIAYFLHSNDETKLAGIEYKAQAVQSGRVWKNKPNKTYTCKEYVDMKLQATY